MLQMRGSSDHLTASKTPFFEGGISQLHLIDNLTIMPPCAEIVQACGGEKAGRTSLSHSLFSFFAQLLLSVFVCINCQNVCAVISMLWTTKTHFHASFWLWMRPFGTGIIGIFRHIWMTDLVRWSSLIVKMQLVLTNLLIQRKVIDLISFNAQFIVFVIFQANILKIINILQFHKGKYLYFRLFYINWTSLCALTQRH